MIFIAGVAELADAHDSKSCEVTPRVGSTPTSGTILLRPSQSLLTGKGFVGIGEAEQRFDIE